MNEETIFAEALEKPEGQERERFLDQACKGDLVLRQKIIELLEQHRKPDAFLDILPDAVEGLATDSFPQPDRAERTGDQIGPYKIREQIGEGGMGIVYVAEREHPFRQKVALKIVKPGLDTKDVVARFAAERQALALMDHPNIAKVVDAGSTELGRPYFVMELVRGISITEYCDKYQLTVPERLELFIQVCNAVQHAHQKGIIHRDLKPTNVLVTEHDGNPVPKVIDFGVAKAMNQRLTKHTIYTAHLQVVGTLQYMSPEQSELSGLDIDTRSDVYALGLLLYELITGTLPFNKETFNNASFDEKRRIIREDEPPKPSTRITSQGDTATTISQSRGTEPERLRRQVCGDLHWIILKGLEKTRDRRYDTAKGFGNDVRRFLSEEMVEARPPSSWYRFNRFYRRNKSLVNSLVVVFLALTVGLTVAIAALRQLSQEKAKVLKEKDNVTLEKEMVSLEKEKVQKEKEKYETTLAKLCDLLKETAISAALNGDELKTEVLIGQALEAGATPAWEEMLLGQLALYGDAPEEAIDHLDRAVTLEPENITARAMLAAAKVLTRYAAADLKGLKARAARFELTEFDKLFLGQALVMEFDPEAAIYINDDRRSALGFAIQAQQLGHDAIDQGDQALAEKAIRKVLVAKELLPKNRFVWTIYASVHHTAYNLGVPSVDKKRFLQVLAEVQDMREYGIGYAVLGMSYMDLGMYPQAKSANLKAADHSDWYWFPTMMSVMQDNLSEGRKFLRKMQADYPENVSTKTPKIALLLLLDLLANKSIDENIFSPIEQKNLMGWDLSYQVWILLVVGKTKEALELVKNNPHSKTEDHKNHRSRYFSYEYLESENAGTTIEELRLKHPNSGLMLGRALFTIGMIRLSENRFTEAREYFQATLDSKCFFAWGYVESQMWITLIDDERITWIK